MAASSPAGALTMTRRMAVTRVAPLPCLSIEGDNVPGRDKWASGENAATTFRNLPEILPSRRIAAGAKAQALIGAKPGFTVNYSYAGKSYPLADFPARTGTTGLLILKGNRIYFEGYYQGADAQDQFLSFSTFRFVIRLHLGD